MFHLLILDDETGNTFEWNGSLTVNVHGPDGKVFDVFSLAWKPEGNTFLDFAASVERYTEE
jgi:hypothetical protein